jgi:hypothetical protein
MAFKYSKADSEKYRIRNLRITMRRFIVGDENMRPRYEGS